MASQPEQDLRYCWYILGDMEQLNDAQQFTLTPVSQIKSHFLTIATRVLYYIMKNCDLFSGKQSEFRESRDEHFARCFEYSELRKGRTFPHTLRTGDRCIPLES